MTAIATPTPATQAVAEWSKIFPRHVTENFTSSVEFIKQLTVVAVSTITYLKNVFPEDSYRMETFGGLKLKILKDNPEDELAKFLTSSLTQAFDAFNKKFLHRLALCFYNDEYKLENLLEYHIFEYTYSPDGVTMNVRSKSKDNVHKSQFSFSSIRERVIHMVRACLLVMQTCEELPPTFDVSLRLYYNDDAPTGYQAPGFHVSDDLEDHLDPTSNHTVRAGWVATPFHKIVLKSYLSSTEASLEAVASQNPPVITLTNPGAAECSVSKNSETVRCPCNSYCSYSDDQYITCQYCNTKQHAACFGFLSAEACVKQHCCVTCSDQDTSLAPTDPQVAVLNVKKRECFCIFRRTLKLCTQVSSISTRDVMDGFGLSKVNADKLMSILRSYKVVEGNPNVDVLTPLSINNVKLKSIITKYFETQQDDIVDRLLAETFASQESQPDPVGDVLGPMEKVSLQNTASIGRVIANEGPVIADSTLKQYKEALDWNDEEELPLNPNPLLEDAGNRRAFKRKCQNDLETNTDKIGSKFGVRNKKAKAK